MNNQSTRPLWERGLAVLVALLMVITMLPMPVQYTAFAEEPTPAAAPATITVTAGSSYTLGDLMAANYGAADSMDALLKATGTAAYSFTLPAAADVTTAENGTQVTVTAPTAQDETNGVTWTPASVSLSLEDGAPVAEPANMDAGENGTYTATLDRGTNTKYAVQVTYTGTLKVSADDQNAVLNSIADMKTVYDLAAAVNAQDAKRGFAAGLLNEDGGELVDVSQLVNDLQDECKDYGVTFTEEQVAQIKSSVFAAIQNGYENGSMSDAYGTLKISFAVEASKYGETFGKKESVELYSSALGTLYTDANKRNSELKSYIVSGATESLKSILGEDNYSQIAQVADVEGVIDDYAASLARSTIAPQLSNAKSSADSLLADERWATAEGLSEENYAILNAAPTRFEGYTDPGYTATDSFALQTVVNANVAQHEVTVNLSAAYYDQNGDSSKTAEKNGVAVLVPDDLAEGQTVQSAIQDTKAYRDALAELKTSMSVDWNDVEESNHYTLNFTENDPGKVYNFSFTPVQKTVKTTDDSWTENYSYGQKIKLPGYDNDSSDSEDKQAYEYTYTVNGTTYYEGDDYRVLDDVTFEREKKIASTTKNLNSLVIDVYGSQLTDGQKAVLSNSYLATGETVHLRYPTSAGVEVKFDSNENNYEVTASEAESNIPGTMWVPVSAIVTKNGIQGTTYTLTGGEVSIPMSDAQNIDGVEISYKLDLANAYAQSDVQELLKKPAELGNQVQNAKALAEMLSRQNNNLNTLNQFGYTIFGVLANENPNQQTTYEWKNGKDSIDALKKLRSECFTKDESHALMLYGIAGQMAKDYADGNIAAAVKTYFDNLETFQPQMKLVSEQLSILMQDANFDKNINDYAGSFGLENLATSLRNAQGDLAKYADNTTKLNDGKYDQTLIQLLLDHDDLNRTVDYADGLVLYSNASGAVDGKITITVKVVVNRSEISVNKIIDEGDGTKTYGTIAAELSNAAENLAKDRLSDDFDYYEYEVSSSELPSGETLIPTEATTYTVNYVPKAYTVKIVDENDRPIAGVDDASVSYGGSYSLPKPTEEKWQYVYTYGDKTLQATTTVEANLTMDKATVALCTNGVLTVKRTATDRVRSDVLAYVDELNKAAAKSANTNVTAAFIPFEKDGQMSIVLRIMPKAENAKDLLQDVGQAAVTSTSVKEVNLNSNSFISQTGNQKLNMQALVDMILNGETGTDYIKGLIDENGDLTEMSTADLGNVVYADMSKVSGDTITVAQDKVISDVSSKPGAQLLKNAAAMDMTTAYGSMSVQLYVTMEDLDTQAENLKNARDLLDKLETNKLATVSASTANGTLKIDTNLQSVYSVGVAVMLLTGDTTLDNLNDVTLQQMVNEIKVTAKPLFTDDYDNLTLSAVQNALGADRVALTEEQFNQAKKLVHMLYTYGTLDENLNKFTLNVGQLLTGENLVSKDILDMIGIDADEKVSIPLQITEAQQQDYAAMVLNTQNLKDNAKKANIADIYSLYTSASDAAAAVKEGGFVVLLKDTDESLTFNSKATLDLNGKTVGGDLTAANGAAVTVRDRSMTNSGEVKGSLNGSFNLKAGTYASTPDESMISTGFKADGNTVRNALYTVSGADNNVTVTLSDDFFNQLVDLDKATAQSTLANVLYDVVLNYYNAASLQVGDYAIYDVGNAGVELFEAKDKLTGTDTVEYINQRINSGVSYDNINGLAADILSKFQGENLKSLTAKSVASYAVTTSPFALTLGAANGKLSATMSKSADKQTSKTFTVAVGSDELAQMQKYVSFSKLEATLKSVKLLDSQNAEVRAGGTFKATVDLAQDGSNEHAVAIATILAAAGASNKAGLVDVLNEYYKNTTSTTIAAELLAELDKATVGDLNKAAQAYRGKTFADLQNSLNLTATKEQLDATAAVVKNAKAAYDLIMLAGRTLSAGNTKALGTLRSGNTSGIYKLTKQVSAVQQVKRFITGVVDPNLDIELTLNLMDTVNPAIKVTDKSGNVSWYDDLAKAVNNASDEATLEVLADKITLNADAATANAITIKNADKIDWNNHKIALKAQDENNGIRKGGSITLTGVTEDTAPVEIDAAEANAFTLDKTAENGDYVYRLSALVEGKDSDGNTVTSGLTLKDTLAKAAAKKIADIEIKGTVTLGESVETGLTGTLTITGATNVTDWGNASFILNDEYAELTVDTETTVTAGKTGFKVKHEGSLYTLESIIIGYGPNALVVTGKGLADTIATPDVDTVQLNEEVALDEEITLTMGRNLTIQGEELKAGKGRIKLELSAQLTVQNSSLEANKDVKSDVSTYYVVKEGNIYRLASIVVGTKKDESTVSGETLANTISNADVVSVKVNYTASIGGNDITLTDRSLTITGAGNIDFNSGHKFKLAGSAALTTDTEILNHVEAADGNYKVVSSGEFVYTVVPKVEKDGNPVDLNDLAARLAEGGTFTIYDKVTVNGDVTLKGKELTIKYAEGGEITDLSNGIYKIVLAPAEGGKYADGQAAATATVPDGVKVEMAAGMQKYFALNHNGKTYTLNLIAPEFTDGGKVEKKNPESLLASYSSQMGVQGEGSTWNLLYLDMKGSNEKAYMTSDQFQNAFTFASKGGNVTMKFAEADHANHKPADLNTATQMDSLNELATGTQVIATVTNPYFNGTMPTQTYVLIMLGDVNCDGQATTAGDAVMMRSEYFKYPENADINWNFFTREAADINQNDIEPVDSGDAVKLQNKYQKPDAYESSLLQG